MYTICASPAVNLTDVTAFLHIFIFIYLGITLEWNKMETYQLLFWNLLFFVFFSNINISIKYIDLRGSENNFWGTPLFYTPTDPMYFMMHITSLWKRTVHDGDLLSFFLESANVFISNEPHVSRSWVLVM